MRKVVAYTLLSVDGVAESPELFVEDFDAEMDAHLADVIRKQDAVLLGRRMHDEWARFWPSSDIEPFAGFVNTVTKYVATSTPLQDSWTSSGWSSRPWWPAQVDGSSAMSPGTGCSW